MKIKDEAEALARFRYTEDLEMLSEFTEEQLQSLMINSNVSIRLSAGWNVSFSGGPAELKQMWKALRALDLEPGDHIPEEQTSYFFTFWRRKVVDEVRQKSLIYMQFSSTVCKRVKVRTEMQSVDIYEVRCDDGEVVSEPAS